MDVSVCRTSTKLQDIIGIDVSVCQRWCELDTTICAFKKLTMCNYMFASTCVNWLIRHFPKVKICENQNSNTWLDASVVSIDASDTSLKCNSLKKFAICNDIYESTCVNYLIRHFTKVKQFENQNCNTWFDVSVVSIDVCDASPKSKYLKKSAICYHIYASTCVNLCQLTY